MEWFVSEDGETVGPWSEAEVARAIDRGLFTTAATVRDNSGGQWTPIVSSPFAHRFASAVPSTPDQNGGLRLAVILVALVAAMIGLFRLVLSSALGV